MITIDEFKSKIEEMLKELHVNELGGIVKFYDCYSGKELKYMYEIKIIN